VAAAVAVGGCGSKKDQGDPIPQSIVSAISQELTSVQNRVDFAQKNPNSRGAGACDDLDSKSFPAIDAEVAKIPSGVSADVRSALNDSIDNHGDGAHRDRPDGDADGAHRHHAHRDRDQAGEEAQAAEAPESP
jgi:hypothetical protein